MVKALVLIAPAGIIRKKRMSGRSRFLFSMGIVPEGLLKWLVHRRLAAGPMYKNENKHVRNWGQKATVGIAISAEVEGDDRHNQTRVPLLAPHFPIPASFYRVTCIRKRLN